MRTHELKTWPEPFQAVVDGRKAFEIRKDDRAFALGDVLRLQEYDPSRVGHDRPDYAGFTGRSLEVRVTYILHGGRFGLPENVCAMSIEPVKFALADEEGKP